MQKLNIAEAATHFHVSKEAIHNRIRRGTLNCVIEDGVKYVVLEQSAPDVPDAYGFMQEERTRLLQKIDHLEQENMSLRDQKEQQLICEREKIEQIYKERDIQLREILQAVTTKMVEQVRLQSQVDTVIDAEVSDLPLSKPLPLKEFLKMKRLKGKAKERIKTRFKKLVNRDKRVFKLDGKVCVDPQQYDYSDLL